MQQKFFSCGICKINAFVTFLVEKRSDIVRKSIDTAIKICDDQEIPVEERRVRRKKKISGERAEDVGKTVVAEVKRCIFKVLDRYKIEAGKRFKELNHLNSMFGFLNPNILLQNENKVNQTKH